MLASTNFLIPNWTFVAELIIFLIVMTVMAKVVLPPLQRSIEGRTTMIRGEMQRAEAARAEAAQATRDRQAVLSRARTGARTLVDEASKEADELRGAARARAQDEYARLLESSRQSIDAERVAARRELLAELPALVVAAAEQVIRADVDPRRHGEIIAGALAQARALGDGDL